MIEVEDHPRGIIVSVRAQPGARRSAVVGIHDGCLKIAVTAPPDKGKANAAIAEVLAAAAGIPKSCVQLLAGATTRHKRFLLEGTSSAGFLDAITTLLIGKQD